ncbi:MAG: hypothetical protein WCS86_03755 [Candidatus Paceibacterota bacterium]
MKYQLSINQKVDVDAFFDYLSENVLPLLPQVHSKKDMNNHIQKILTEATKLLQRFRPGWQVVLSTKLSKQDPCPTLIELIGEAEEFNLMTGEQLHEVRSQLFLERQKSKWVGRDTYYNYVQNFRNMGDANVQIPIHGSTLYACYASEISELFPFVKGNLSSIK